MAATPTKEAAPVQKEPTLKDESEQFGVPVRGKVLGSFSSFSLGLVWVVPDVRANNMLTTTPVYDQLEEKIYYSLNLATETHCKDPTTIQIFKVEGCTDVHLRAVNRANYDEGVPMDMLNPEDFVFSAAIVNNKGQTIREERSALSYMAAKRRYWDLQGFIEASEFDSVAKYLHNGDMFLRLTFHCRMAFPIIPTDSVNTSNLAEESISDPSNANLEQKQHYTTEELEIIDAMHSLFDEVALGVFPARLKKLLKREKYTDGSIVLKIPGKKGAETTRIFPVHRGILSAQSPGFESAFEKQTQISFTKYSIRSFEVLLNYIYTGELICDKRLSILEELIEVADDLEVFGLKDQCIRTILEAEADGSIPGGIQIYELGDKLDSLPLKLAAVERLREFKDELVENPEFKQFIKSQKLEEVFFPLLK